MDLRFGNCQRAAWPWPLVGIEKQNLGYKMVYATAFIEQMASLPLTCSSTFLTTKVGAEHIPNTRLLAVEK